MLENLRFHPGEEANSPEFASSLASLADVYVNDAFGAAHRAHASIEGVTDFLPAAAGFLMARELEMLAGALKMPRRPLTAILGGAKVSDKIRVLANLAERADALIVGGGMSATFLKAAGLEVGSSMVEDDHLGTASDLIEAARRGGPDLLIPVDLVVASSFAESAARRTVDAESVPAGWTIMDIGPRTRESFAGALKGSGTVPVERHDGRVRVGALCCRHSGCSRYPGRPQRRRHHSRRRLDRRGRVVVGPRGEDDARLHGWRRLAGVLGG